METKYTEEYRDWLRNQIPQFAIPEPDIKYVTWASLSEDQRKVMLGVMEAKR